MSGAASLERRYRRLLGCYPAGHRSTYGEEMIGVLLAAAPAGQRRPGLADTLNLFGGAAQVRLRKLATGTPDPGWRNALALASLIAPFGLVALVPRQNLGWMASLTWHTPSAAAGFAGLALLLAPVTLGLLELRRVAATVAVATMIEMIGQAAASGLVTDLRLAGYLVLIAVQAFALAASPGPRHALSLITGKTALLALPWLAIVAYAGNLVPTHYPVMQFVMRFGIMVIAVACLPALATAGGRRLLVLLIAIPGSAFVVSLLSFANVDFYSMSFAAALVAEYLPPIALSGLVLLAVRRSAGRTRPTPPAAEVTA